MQEEMSSWKRIIRGRRMQDWDSYVDRKREELLARRRTHGVSWSSLFIIAKILPFEWLQPIHEMSWWWLGVFVCL